jgi:hypothetical protein
LATLHSPADYLLNFDTIEDLETVSANYVNKKSSFLRGLFHFRSSFLISLAEGVVLQEAEVVAGLLLFLLLVVAEAGKVLVVEVVEFPLFLLLMLVVLLVDVAVLQVVVEAEEVLLIFQQEALVV